MMIKHQNRFLFLFVLICVIFGSSTSDTIGELSNGKRTVRTFLSAVQKNRIKLVQGKLTKKSRKSLFKEESSLKVQLYHGAYNLNKLFSNEDSGFIDEYSATGSDSMKLHYYEARDRVDIGKHFVFFLAKVSGEWKVDLLKTLYHSRARFLIHPKFFRLPNTQRWRRKKMVGKSRLYDATMWQEHYITGAGDGSVHLWRQGGKTPSQTLVDYRFPVEELKLLPEQSLLAVRADTSVQIWDLRKKKKKAQVQKLYDDKIQRRIDLLKGNTHEPTSMAVAKSAGIFIVGFETRARKRKNSEITKGIVQILNAENGNTLHSEPFQKKIDDVSISDNGKFAAAISRQGEVVYWKTRNSSEKHDIDQIDSAKRVFFSEDPRSIYVLGNDRLFQYYIKSDALRTVNLHGNQKNTCRNCQVQMHEDSETVGVLHPFDRRIDFYNGKKMAYTSSVTLDPTTSLKSFRFTNQYHLIVNTGNEMMHLDRRNNNVLFTLEQFLNPVDAIDVFDRGKRAVVGQKRNHRSNIKFLNVRDENIEKKIDFEGKLLDLELSPDDATLAALFRLNTSSSSNKKRTRLVIIDAHTYDRKETRTVNANIQDLSFTDEGHLLYGLDGDEVVHLDAARNKVKRRYKVPEVVTSEDHELSVVRASSDGRYIAAASVDGWPYDGNSKLLLWDTDKESRVFESKSLDGYIQTMLFTDEGNRLIASGNDYPVSTFSIPSMKKEDQLFEMGLVQSQHISDHRLLVVPTGGQGPHHIMGLKQKQLWNLPGIRKLGQRTASHIKINTNKDTIIGAFVTGEIIVWKRAK